MHLCKSKYTVSVIYVDPILHAALLQMYEKLEEVRLQFLRNELWVATNICSQICVEDDNVSALEGESYLS